MFCGDRILVPQGLPFYPKFLEMRIFHNFPHNYTTAILFRLLELSLEKVNRSITPNPALEAFKKVVEGADEGIESLQRAVENPLKEASRDQLDYLAHLAEGTDVRFSLGAVNMTSFEKFCEIGEFKLESNEFGVLGNPKHKLEASLHRVKGAVYLGYKNFSQKSFVDLPCGHFGLKFVYFGAMARAAENFAVSKCGMEQAQIKSECCQEEITSEIWREIIQGGEETKSAGGSRRKKCQMCPTNIPDEEFTGVCQKHSVCEKCVMQNILTADFFFAPCCFQILDPTKLLEYERKLSEIPHLRLLLGKTSHDKTLRYLKMPREGGNFELKEAYESLTKACGRCWRIKSFGVEPCNCREAQSIARIRKSPITSDAKRYSDPQGLPLPQSKVLPYSQKRNEELQRVDTDEREEADPGRPHPGSQRTISDRKPSSIEMQGNQTSFEAGQRADARNPKGQPLDSASGQLKSPLLMKPSSAQDPWRKLTKEEAERVEEGKSSECFSMHNQKKPQPRSMSSLQSQKPNTSKSSDKLEVAKAGYGTAVNQRGIPYPSCSVLGSCFKGARIQETGKKNAAQSGQLSLKLPVNPPRIATRPPKGSDNMPEGLLLQECKPVLCSNQAQRVPSPEDEDVKGGEADEPTAGRIPGTEISVRSGERVFPNKQNSQHEKAKSASVQDEKMCKTCGIKCEKVSPQYRCRGECLCEKCTIQLMCEGELNCPHCQEELPKKNLFASKIRRCIHCRNTLPFQDFPLEGHCPSCIKTRVVKGSCSECKPKLKMHGKQPHSYGA